MLSKRWIEQLPINKIQSVTPVFGGYMNKSYCIKTQTDKFFMKVQPDKGMRFFKYEVYGLKLLKQAVKVPTVISYGQINNDGYLILNWQKFGDFNKGNQYKLGQMVAKMHRIHSKKFGFNLNLNFVTCIKNNTWQDSWSKFYIEQRLDPSVDFLRKHGHWNAFREKHYQNMKTAFLRYYSHHKVVPSLIHGDLWTGNCEFTSKGLPMLIDPNALFADRELDLALTTLPSSDEKQFTDDFYRGYNSVYPIRPGFSKRKYWYQFNYVLNVCLVDLNNNKWSYVDKILSKF